MIMMMLIMPKVIIIIIIWEHEYKRDCQGKSEVTRTGKERVFGG
jgi:hypothetical protein